MIDKKVEIATANKIASSIEMELQNKKYITFEDIQKIVINYGAEIKFSFIFISGNFYEIISEVNFIFLQGEPEEEIHMQKKGKWLLNLGENQSELDKNIFDAKKNALIAALGVSVDTYKSSEKENKREEKKHFRTFKEQGLEEFPENNSNSPFATKEQKEVFKKYFKLFKMKEEYLDILFKNQNLKTDPSLKIYSTKLKNMFVEMLDENIDYGVGENA